MERSRKHAKHFAGLTLLALISSIALMGNPWNRPTAVASGAKAPISAGKSNGRTDLSARTRIDWLNGFPFVDPLRAVLGRNLNGFTVGVPSSPAMSTFVVTSLGEFGGGTLRQAIFNANITSGPDLITFSVAGTINITNPNQLPTLEDTTGGTIIDATTAPGYAGSPVVILKGPGTTSLRGIDITSANNEVRGLRVCSFLTGIYISGSSASGNVITGNYIGTDGAIAVPNGVGINIDNAPNNRVGTNGDGVNDAAERNVISGNNTTLGAVRIIKSTSTGNASNNVIAGNFIGVNANGSAAIANLGHGVELSADNNLVGADGNGVADVAERNVISGNKGAGISIGASNNVVAGNYIGTDFTGTAAIGNATFNNVGSAGIILSNGNNRIGTDGNGIADEAERNVISGNNFDGVKFNGASGNILAGNFIGTSASGTSSIPNTRMGVFVGSGTNHRIGTDGNGIADNAERNVISGNTNTGIFVQNTTTVGTIIAGNYIGTDVNGAVALGNGGGVSVGDGASNTRIGTDGNGIADASERNVISGNNGSAVWIAGGSGNVLAGNYIGTNAAGTSPLGNSGSGLSASGAVRIGSNNDGINDAAEANTISYNSEGIVIFSVGGSTVIRNVVSFNAGRGVVVRDTTNVQNKVSKNSIFSNGGLGIDLSNPFFSDGVTPNDSGDADTGANNLQNFPVLTSASSSGGSTTIQGTLNSKPNASFVLEFFTNATCDASGFGEGATFIGSTTITTDSNGNANFAPSFPVVVASGSLITATATDSANNTSEFSQCFLLADCPSNLTINGSVPDFCQGSSQAISLSASGSNLSGATITWKLDGATTLGSGTTLNTTLSGLGAGSHTITATASKAGCSDVSASTSFTIKPKPVVTISGAPAGEICFGTGINLSANVTPTGGTLSYSWSKNGSPFSTAATVTDTPGAGTNTYALTVTRDGCASDAAQVTVVVNPKPTVTISGPAEVCEAGAATLTANPASGTAPYTFSWSTGATSPSISPSTATAGSFNFSVTVTDSKGCTATASKTLVVNPKPTLTISGPTEVCESGVISLTASPAGGTAPYSFSWNTGANTASITPSTASAGSFNYSVTVTDGKGCTVTASTTLVVKPKPVVTISGAPAGEICFGAGVNLTANVSPTGGTLAFNWSKDGAPFSTAATISDTPAAGSHTYAVTVTRDGCASNTAQVTVVVNPPPTVTIGGPSEVCQTSPVTLTANPTGGTAPYTFSWSTSANTASISPSTGTAGSFNFAVTVTDSKGCTATASRTLTVNPKPTVTIGGPAEVCQTGAAALTATPAGGTGPYTFNWSTGATTASISLDTTNAGSFNFSVTITDSKGCSATASTSLTVKPKPVAIITGAPAGEICLGTGINLSANISPTGGALSFNWSKNGAPFSTATTITDTPGVGTNTYALTVTRNGCASDTAQATVVVNPNPTVSISGPAEVCEAGAVTLTANPAGGTAPYTFSWNTGATAASISPNTASAGTLNFSVTITDSKGCTATASKILVVNPKPMVTISGPAEVCESGAVTLTANPSGGAAPYSFSWNTGATTASISPSTTSAGSFNFSVTITDSKGCTATASKTLVVSQKPTVTISGAPTGEICLGMGVSLTANVSPPGGTATFNWSKDGAPFGTTATINDTPGTGSHTYAVSVTRSGCASETAQVTVGVFDYSLAVAPNPLSLSANQQGSFTVTLTLAPGSVPPPAINLSTNGLPPSITGTFTSPTVTPSVGGKSTFLLISPTGPATTLPGGVFNFTVTGSDPQHPSCADRVAAAQLIVVTALTSGVARDTDCNSTPNGSDVVFTPSGSTTKLTATNPGGFMYNTSVLNTGGASSAVSITLDLPPNPDAAFAGLPPGTSAFALWGARPVKVFTGDPCSPGATDVTPNNLTISTTGGSMSQPLSTSSTLVTSPSSIVIPAVNIPAGGTVWVQVHVRYALLGSTGWPTNSETTFIRANQFKTSFAFAGQTLTNPLITDFTAAGKKVTGIGGNALDVNGTSKGGLKVVVDGTTVGGNPSSCANPNAITQNLTGFYFVPLSANTTSTVSLYNATCNQISQRGFGPVVQGQFLQVDFSHLSPADPVIEGVVGTGQGGVGNVTVELINVAGRVVAMTRTSSGGYYSFRFAAPGTYTVRIIPPASYYANNTSVTLRVEMFEVVRADFILRR